MKKKVSSQATYEQKARDAGVKVRHVIDAASGEVTEFAEEVESRILKKPVESTMLALGIGLVLGAILGRR
jgi:hypothetical protein